MPEAPMPYDPTIAAIRYGYGLPAADPGSVAAMLDRLAGPDRALADWPAPNLAETVPLVQELGRLKVLRRNDPAQDKPYRAVAAELMQMTSVAGRAVIVRCMQSPDGFRERLAGFWGDHFTVVGRRPETRILPFVLLDEAIRPNMTGRFADLLTAVTLHPAMLIYLDQVSSFGPASIVGQRRKRGLNENLARELLELHTLGVGAGYGQDDVRQLAELLTGLTYDLRRGMVFDPRRAEPGAETVLGQVYDGKGMAPIRAALRDIAARPEVAAHLARKLAVHFVADDPDPALVAAIEAAWVGSGGDLPVVYGALLGHEAAWGPELQKARQPFDFMIAALRALQVPGEDIARMGFGPLRRMVLEPMAAMGQPFKTPGGPDGWSEAAEAWITPQGLAARITWGMEVPPRLVRPLPDPVDLAQRALGPMASERLLWAVARAENMREGVGLVLASPEFNRR